MLVTTKNPYKQEYLTAGKLYNAYNIDEYGFNIIDNNGFKILCLFEECAHAKRWSIVKTPNSDNLATILSKYSKRKLSVALGHHHSYLSRLMKKEISDEVAASLMQRLTIDWNSTKPYRVNDGKHVPYIIRPASCVTDKHKQWFTKLFFSGAVAL